MTHGKIATYNKHRCRCDECRAAISAYRRAERERRHQERMKNARVHIHYTDEALTRRLLHSLATHDAWGNPLT